MDSYLAFSHPYTSLPENLSDACFSMPSTAAAHFIGSDKNLALRRFLTALPVRLDSAKGGAELHSVIVTVSEDTGRATGIRRVCAR